MSELGQTEPFGQGEDRSGLPPTAALSCCPSIGCECHEAVPTLASVPTMSLITGIRALHLALWDEDRGRLVGIDEVVSPGLDGDYAT